MDIAQILLFVAIETLANPFSWLGAVLALILGFRLGRLWAWAAVGALLAYLGMARSGALPASAEILAISGATVVAVMGTFFAQVLAMQAVLKAVFTIDLTGERNAQNR